MSDSKRRKPPLVADKRYGSATRTKATKPKSKAAPKKKAATKRTASRKTSKPSRKKGGGGGIIGALRRFIGWVFGLIWGFTWRIGMIVALLIALAVGLVYTTLPDVTALLDGRARGSVTMLDKDGNVFAWRGDQFGGVVTTETVSPDLKNAVIATEDKRFYRHFGISPRGVASAVRINLSEGRGPLSGHGGSTITQQTAKLLCLGVPYDETQWESEKAYEDDCRQGSLWRKIKEAVYSMAMEVKYSKDEILTIYLNRAFLGAGARGFEAASQRYFGISAAEVDPAQAAMLAGLLVAPTRYAPTNNLKRSQDRARVIVGLMEDQGYLTTAEADSARANPAELSAAAAARAGGYFADWVMSSGPEYFTRNTTEDVIIRTTLDQRIQTSAEEAMNFVFQEKVRKGSKAQAAIVVMSADGAVRGMVGGRKTRVTGAFNRATQALRQTGSAFKPFVYATALELGHSPLDTVVDAPYCLNIPGSGEWCPKNYTNKHYGQVTLTQALKDSLNIPAVKVSEAVGRDLVRKVAADFGIDSDLAAGPALALGASESTLLEMTGAYAGILNGGSSVTPYGLVELQLLGDDTPLMGTGGGIGERVIQTAAAEQLIWMMEKVVSEGSGRRAALPGWQAAGKTGTTQAARDAWFIGFTADYVTGVWMGYDDNTPLSGVTGGGLPAEIWHETMVRVQDGLAPKPLPMRAPVQPTRIPEPKRNKGGGLGDAVDKLLKDIFGGRN
ncbi:transglycosylase domain-containing protein [Tropicibacter sp. R16_0]|uniref:transglycosylase domain-containing protein n=1 Tax=Tropicibacter sp. R16_0 TaxID=2821102 RepID=UPI001ADA998D|nr:transglycosylase domain-containing protein [Tropicibacter sp. R16_0]MBO9451866.1 transglycosylase domain-containing protein [Tropicibacter sp. R16_0]